MLTTIAHTDDVSITNLAVTLAASVNETVSMKTVSLDSITEHASLMLTMKDI